MIRKAEIEDAKRIAELYISSSKVAYNKIVTDNHLQKLSIEEKTNQYTEKIQNKIDEIYVSEENGAINGFLTFSKNEKFFELLQIYIDPLMKKQGIGRKLISFLENLATNCNIYKIFLWVIRDNEAAITFYEKLGFQNDQEERFLEKYKVQQVRFSKELTNGNST